jgi:hypothetical protein
MRTKGPDSIGLPIVGAAGRGDGINGENVTYAIDVIYALPQARRHSGAPRSGEPGIHNPESLGSNPHPGVWIPGSGLRPAPE